MAVFLYQLFVAFFFSFLAVEVRGEWDQFIWNKLYLFSQLCKISEMCFWLFCLLSFLIIQTLYLFIEKFNPLSFKVIIDGEGFIIAVLLTVLHLSCSSFVTLFSRYSKLKSSSQQRIQLTSEKATYGMGKILANHIFEKELITKVYLEFM